MTSTIAIGVAILLPVEARMTAVRLNAGFHGTDGRGFRFTAALHPHITLGQHFLTRDTLPDAQHRIGEVISRFTPFPVAVTGARGGRTTQVLVVERSAALQQLHEQVMHAMKDCEIASGDTEAFEQSEPPRPADVAWVAGFRAQSSYQHFAPHITIGIGPQQLTVAPFQFVAKGIAICQLGRFCTCRDRLASWSL